MKWLLLLALIGFAACTFVEDEVDTEQENDEPVELQIADIANDDEVDDPLNVNKLKKHLKKKVKKFFVKKVHKFRCSLKYVKCLCKKHPIRCGIELKYCIHLKKPAPLPTGMPPLPTSTALKALKSKALSLLKCAIPMKCCMLSAGKLRRHFFVRYGCVKRFARCVRKQCPRPTGPPKPPKPSDEEEQDEELEVNDQPDYDAMAEEVEDEDAFRKPGPRRAAKTCGKKLIMCLCKRKNAVLCSFKMHKCIRILKYRKCMRKHGMKPTGKPRKRPTRPTGKRPTRPTGKSGRPWFGAKCGKTFKGCVKKAGCKRFGMLRKMKCYFDFTDCVKAKCPTRAPKADEEEDY